MAKKDDITLIIAKAFSRQSLTESEISLCKDLTIQALISEHGLNDLQSEEVMKWCAISCAALTKKDSIDMLNEGFLGNIFNKFRGKKTTEKTPIEYTSLVNMSMKELVKDGDVLSEYLEKAFLFTESVKSKGSYRKTYKPKKEFGKPREPGGEKDVYGDTVDVALGSTDFDYTSRITENHLTHLRTLSKDLKRVYMIMYSSYRPPHSSAKLEENAPARRIDLQKQAERENPLKNQYHDLMAITDSHSLYKREIFRSDAQTFVCVKQMFESLFRQAGLIKRKEKIKAQIALMNHIKEIYNVVQKTIQTEVSSDTFSHSSSDDVLKLRGKLNK